MSPQIIMAVAFGGALGAVMRFTAMSTIGHYYHGSMPWSTFAVNLVGSFALGALLETMALAWSPTPEVRAFMVIGLLGAFTTFSTFSMDLYYLLDRGAIVQAGTYAVGSVLLCVVGFWAGMALLRNVLA